MNSDYQRLIKSIMKLIAAQFGENCEVVLHDWSNEYDKTIIAIENGHVSGRHVGCGGSNLGLEVMRGTSDGSNQLNYLTQLPDGRMLRSSSLYLEDENGQKIGALCINSDITDFINIQRVASQITMIPDRLNGDGSGTKELFTKDVNELLDYLLVESVHLIGKIPSEMTKEEKKQAICYLDQKGALLITKSGPRICQYFGISKYTLYSYLEEIHQKQREEKNGQEKTE